MPSELPSQLSDSELKWGYWWVLHRTAVKHMVEAALALLSVTLMGYALWYTVDWLASRQAEEEALRSLVTTSLSVEEYRQATAPMPLEIGTVTAVPSGQGLYDLVAEVKNPNLRWAVKEMPFIFTSGAEQAEGTAFLLPLESKFVVKLGVPYRIKPSQLLFSPGEISWLRVRDLSALPIPVFEISSQELEQVVAAGESSPSATRLSFDLKNDSPYSFWQAGVTVVLTQRSSVQAVGHQVLSSLDSGATRPVEFLWPSSVITADNVAVKPEVNILDPRVLK